MFIDVKKRGRIFKGSLQLSFYAKF